MLYSYRLVIDNVSHLCNKKLYLQQTLTIYYYSEESHDLLKCLFDNASHLYFIQHISVIIPIFDNIFSLQPTILSQKPAFSLLQINPSQSLKNPVTIAFITLNLIFNLYRITYRKKPVFMRFYGTSLPYF